MSLFWWSLGLGVLGKQVFRGSSGLESLEVIGGEQGKVLGNGVEKNIRRLVYNFLKFKDSI